MEERRVPPFVEKISLILVVGSGLAAMLVLLDPIITLNMGSGFSIRLGGDGFSEQLKGAVMASIVISGFSGVITYWLGASKQGDKAQDSMNNIATQSAPTAAAAVAAQVLSSTGDGKQRPLTAEEIAAAAPPPKKD